MMLFHYVILFSGQFIRITFGHDVILISGKLISTTSGCDIISGCDITSGRGRTSGYDVIEPHEGRLGGFSIPNFPLLDETSYGER